MSMKSAAGKTPARQRRIQDEAEALDAKAQGGKLHKPAKKTAVQAGTHAFPENPLPEQHGEKPMLEADLDPAPQFMAPDYRGSGKLEGKVAIITGGDSGIGRAVAVLFAREGADVVVVYLDEDQDAEDTKQHVEQEGRRCLLMPGDVRKPAFCQRVVDKTLKTFGRLDILVNNAAFQQHTKRIEDLTEAHFDETMKTNIYGYFNMAKAAVPHLQRGASIINSGSVTGLEGSKELLDYSTTKGAIHAFTKSLASNLLERGIRVNAVAPGPVWTPLNPADRPADKIPSFGEATDMHRPAQPEEISPAYVFLAAPACSSYISGIILPITGSVGEH